MDVVRKETFLHKSGLLQNSRRCHVFREHKSFNPLHSLQFFESHFQCCCHCFGGEAHPPVLSSDGVPHLSSAAVNTGSLLEHDMANGLPFETYCLEPWVRNHHLHQKLPELLFGFKSFPCHELGHFFVASPFVQVIQVCQAEVPQLDTPNTTSTTLVTHPTVSFHSFDLRLTQMVSCHSAFHNEICNLNEQNEL
jgi:hypothetical protein